MKNSSHYFCNFLSPLMGATFISPILLLFILFASDKFEVSIEVFWLSYIILVLFFGRVYCGFMCLPGMVQRLCNLIGKIIFKKSFIMPEKLDKYMKLFKYIFSSIVVIWSILKLKILINGYVPFDQYTEIWDNLGYVQNLLDWTVTTCIIVAIVGSIIYKSFFCKYFCLKGSVLGLTSNLSTSRIKIDISKCTNCKLCTMNCPMNIQVNTTETVKSMDCIHCQQCVIVCPKKAISNTFWGIHISPIVLIPLIIVTFILLLLVLPYFL